MKILGSIFLGLMLLSIANAQNMTIILVRHAEKDVSPMANKQDPDLSEIGRKRAQKLSEVLLKYKPKQIFSTRFRRTRMTAEPLANGISPDYRLQTQIYDSSEPEEFVRNLLLLKTKCIVVFGHSNTSPNLANLLLKQSKYKDLAENEFDKIFVIKIRGKKITDHFISY